MIENKRQSYRDFTHMKEHVENALENLREGYNEKPLCKDCEKVKKRDRSGEIETDLKLVLTMIISSIEREKKSNRTHGPYRLINIMYKIAKFFSIAVLLAVLSGCAGKATITRNDKGYIEEIKIKGNMEFEIVTTPESETIKGKSSQDIIPPGLVNYVK